MAGKPTSTDPGSERLRAAEDALRKVQAQAAALEDLSEQLSLAVHVLEAELATLRERPVVPSSRPPGRSNDADGARLVVLNMALEGEPREVVERYLAEHFDIPNRERLLDDVYAAAGG
jgi:hypothetical protein